MAKKKKTDLIAARVREARLTAKLTQAQVAELMKVNRVSYSLIESGQRNLTVDDLSQLTQILDVSPLFLLGQSVSTDEATFHPSRKTSGSSLDQFLVFDYLFLIALLGGERNYAEIVKSVSDMRPPIQMPSVSTIHSRLNSLVHEGLVVRRLNASSRRLYFSLTGRGKDQFLAISALLDYLKKLTEITKTE